MARDPSVGQPSRGRLPLTRLTPSWLVASINTTGGPDGVTPEEDLWVSSYDDENASVPVNPLSTTLEPVMEAVSPGGR